MIVLPLPLGGRIPRRLGVATAGVGGALILLEGWMFASPGFGVLAQVALLTGGSIVGLAVVADRPSRYRPILGGVIVILSLASFFGLSGYLLGTFLGSLGGTLIVLSPGVSSTSPRRGKGTFSSADLGPPCATCGKHVPTWTTKCPYCGMVSQPPGS